MSEKVYRREGTEWIELPGRDPSRLYSMTTHPRTGEVCYREWSDAERAKREADSARNAAKREAQQAAREAAKRSTIDLIAELQARISALEGKA